MRDPQRWPVAASILLLVSGCLGDPAGPAPAGPALPEATCTTVCGATTGAEPGVEPSLAINPTNPDNLVVAFIEGD